MYVSHSYRGMEERGWPIPFWCFIEGLSCADWGSIDSLYLFSRISFSYNDTNIEEGARRLLPGL